MIPSWFLYLTGFSMLILGGLQLQQRPHQPGAGLYSRFVNVGTLWSLVCIAVGVGLLAIALGYWHGPLGAPPREPPATHRRYH